MSWRTKPLAGYDTETDGIDVEDTRIITACVGVVRPGQGWVAQNWLLKPSRPIPAECTAIHGITTEHAEANGVDRAQGLIEICAALYTAWDEGAMVCGHNVVFDLTVLDRELRREGHNPLEINGAVLDTLVLDKARDPYRKGGRKLVDVAAHHGIHLSADDAHGAEPDALAATRLAWKLCDGLDDNPNNVLAYQRMLYSEQRVSFARYLAKQGKSLDDPSTDWPIRPYRRGAAA
jgi:DNA polymerase III subunit epsilon